MEVGHDRMLLTVFEVQVSYAYWTICPSRVIRLDVTCYVHHLPAIPLSQSVNLWSVVKTVKSRDEMKGLRTHDAPDFTDCLVLA